MLPEERLKHLEADRDQLAVALREVREALELNRLATAPLGVRRAWKVAVAALFVLDREGER